MQGSYHNVLTPKTRYVRLGVVFDKGHTVAAALAFVKDLVNASAAAVLLVNVDGPVGGIAAVGRSVDGDVDLGIGSGGGLTALWLGGAA